MAVPARRRLSCERARAIASAALDSDLSEVERLHVVGHAQDCAECRTVIEAMERFTGELRATPPLVPRRTPRVARRRRSLPLVRVSAFAAAMLVAAFAGALLSSSEEGGPGGAGTPAKPVIRIAELRLDQLHSGDLLFNRLPPDLRPSRAEQLREHLAMV